MLKVQHFLDILVFFSNFAKNFKIMEYKYITDTDFLPESLSHFNNRTTLDDGLYQIVYGTLQDDVTLTEVCDLVIRVADTISNVLIKKFCLPSWKKSIDNIVKTLGKLKDKEKCYLVNIPFTHYQETLEETVSRLQLAEFTINEMIDKGEKPYEIKDTPTYPFPVMEINKLLEGYYEEFLIDLCSEPNLREDIDYWKQILFDEMYRRGIRQFKEPNGNKNETVLSPSKYYNEPQLFMESAFIGKEELTGKIHGSDTVGQEQPTDSAKALKMKEKAGVLFYMLQELAPINNDNQHLVIALINRACDKEYNIKKPKAETNNNTIKRYITTFKNLGLTEEKQDFIDNVRSNLAEYGFDLPTE